MAKDVKTVIWAWRALDEARRKVEDVILSLHFVVSHDMLAWSAEKNAKSGAFWCILVHGERTTLKIRRISGVRRHAMLSGCMKKWCIGARDAPGFCRWVDYKKVQPIVRG